ncbi:MAG: hypothetical protein VSS75_014125 [Candidatus Parabeggiatoa sp.]|nr:hypothetical protein [Candidatus Parabeggiatoa sp.]
MNEKEIGKIVIDRKEYKFYPLSSGKVQFEGPGANLMFNCKDMMNIVSVLNYYLKDAKGCKCGARQNGCSCL